MTEKKIRWGILSTAKIGLTKVIPGTLKSPSSQVLAIASRDAARARQAADALGIPRAYGSYDDLLADPDIDAIYNPLPNHLHIPLTLAAARAGKHVLCEKPIAITAEEAEQLRQVPPGIVVAEAFMIRHHPQWLRAREIVRSGELGTVTAVNGMFSYYLDDPGNVRNQADIGGGGLLDIGCYPLTAARFFYEAEPRRVVALVERDPAFGTDRQASVLADFGGGRHLNFTVSTLSAPYQRVTVLGTQKRLDILIPFNAPTDTPTLISIDDGSRLDGSSARIETLAVADQYACQAEAFARALLGGPALPWGIEDAIASMRALSAMFASERAGGWVKV